MQLSLEQKQALERGEPVSLKIDETECVLLRRDLYERIRTASESLPRDVVGELVNRAMAEYDPGDALLDSYQKYRT